MEELLIGGNTVTLDELYVQLHFTANLYQKTVFSHVLEKKRIVCNINCDDFIYLQCDVRNGRVEIPTVKIRLFSFALMFNLQQSS